MFIQDSKLPEAFAKSMALLDEAVATHKVTKKVMQPRKQRLVIKKDDAETRLMKSWVKAYGWAQRGVIPDLSQRPQQQTTVLAKGFMPEGAAVVNPATEEVHQANACRAELARCMEQMRLAGVPAAEAVAIQQLVEAALNQKLAPAASVNSWLQKACMEKCGHGA
ncbi:hypothetical protein ACVOZ6_004682 [Escherichia coli]